MKAEAWIFAACTIFLVLVTPAYWLVTDASEHGGDWTGTSALVMTTLLTLMVTIYLGFHANEDGPAPRGPQGRRDRRRRRGARLLPAVLLVAAVDRHGAGHRRLRRGGRRVVAGDHRVVLGGLALVGWIYEYYRGEHAH